MFGQVVSQFLGRAVDQLAIEDPRVARAVRWMNRLQQHALGPWAATAESMIPCRVAWRTQEGATVRCHDVAIGACLGCAAAVCFGHSFIDGENGQVICRGCIERLQQLTPEPVPIPSAPSSSPGDISRERLRARYLKRLGFGNDEQPSDTDINRHWRDRVVQSHPDKARTDGQRKKRHRRTVLLNEARDWLLEEARGAAA